MNKTHAPNPKAPDRNAFKFTYQRGKLYREFVEYVEASCELGVDELPAHQRLAMEDAFYAGVLSMVTMVSSRDVPPSQVADELDQFGLMIEDRYRAAGLIE